MAEKLDPKETVSIEELLMSQVVSLDALIGLLVKKGIITEAELLDEIKRVNAERVKSK